jgi:hypothetical protein
LDNSHPHLVFKHAYNRLVSSKIVFDSQLKGSGFEPANFNASCSLMVNRHSLYFALDENVCLWSFCSLSHTSTHCTFNTSTHKYQIMVSGSYRPKKIWWKYVKVL